MIAPVGSRHRLAHKLHGAPRGTILVVHSIPTNIDQRLFPRRVVREDGQPLASPTGWTTEPVIIMMHEENFK